MWEEARFVAEDPRVAIARIRIGNILKQQTVASQRTLEAKISESGQGEKPAPHFISHALRELHDPSDDRDPMVIRTRPDDAPCELFHLASAREAELSAALKSKIELENTWNKYARKVQGLHTVGNLGERIVHDAFRSHSGFWIAPGWGRVKDVNGIAIPADDGKTGEVDGLVILADVAPQFGCAVVEVKNKREWIYPRDAALWDIIRNGFAVNAVPIIFARKIYSSSFTYVLSRVGGLGIQMHAQFIPTVMKEKLDPCRDKNGLGFKDLNFTEQVPKNLISAIPLLAKQILTSRQRMEDVRSIVAPHLDVLADPKQRGEAARRYREVQRLLDVKLGRPSRD